MTSAEAARLRRDLRKAEARAEQESRRAENFRIRTEALLAENRRLGRRVAEFESTECEVCRSLLRLSQLRNGEYPYASER